MSDVGLGDLLNLDYGYDFGGTPLWDFSGYSLNDPEWTTAQILGEQFGMGPMRGNDFTLGVSGIDEVPMRPSVFEFAPDGTPVALGYRGADGMIQTLDGNPVAANPFNINPSGGSSLKNLLDAGVRPTGSGGSGGAVISMPNLTAPGSERISGPSTPGVPQSPIPQTSGSVERGAIPMPQPVPYAQAPDDVAGGLRRLFGGMR